MPKFPSTLHIALERMYYTLHREYHEELKNQFKLEGSQSCSTMLIYSRAGELENLQLYIHDLPGHSSSPLKGLSAVFHKYTLEYCKRLMKSYEHYEQLINYENHVAFKADENYIALISAALDSLSELKNYELYVSACVAQLECGRGE